MIMSNEVEGDLDLADIEVTEPPAIWKPEEETEAFEVADKDDDANG
jgi:hypothetical protein